MGKQDSALFKTVDIISLGCSKNLVDSERLITQLKANNIRVEHDPTKPRGEVVVINTCGFIGDAKEESIDTILQFAKLRKKGKIKRLYVMGCLSQRYKADLEDSIPEVDKYYGKFDWKGIITEIGATYRRDVMSERTTTTPSHYAYLKISEGCNRMCSYCAIPLITGKHTSRPMEEIIAEVENLVARGVKEFQVIAQDLSSYGTDLYKENRLAQLIDQMAQIKGVEWIRLHYAYPAGFPKDLLPVMARHSNVCKYIDLALQHISDHMLSLMRRKITKQQTLNLLALIRQEVPGIHIRTTFIAGHPGETEEDFAELLQFVKEARFERLGVFPYSHEEDTYSYKNYSDDVPDELKQSRAEQIMMLQEQISKEINETKVGTKMRVIIDRKEDGFYIGRTEFDSPEVDPEVVISASEPLIIGNMYEVTITNAEEYDLEAKY